MYHTSKHYILQVYIIFQLKIKFKKPDIKEHILCDNIYMKFSTRQKLAIVREVTASESLWGVLTGREQDGGFWGTWIRFRLDLVSGHMDIYFCRIYQVIHLKVYEHYCS
jgi:hypothetical protein